MRIICVVLASIFASSVAQAKGIQLFNPDVFGQPTSTAIKILQDKKPDDIEPVSVLVDIRDGKYIASSLFYCKKVTFEEARETLNKQYKTNENLSLVQYQDYRCPADAGRPHHLAPCGKLPGGLRKPWTGSCRTGRARAGFTALPVHAGTDSVDPYGVHQWGRSQHSVYQRRPYWDGRWNVHVAILRGALKSMPRGQNWDNGNQQKRSFQINAGWR